MASKKKLLQAAAGSAGGEALDIPDVFSTFLYEGTGANRSIVNGIDLTEGGLVWIKSRNNTFDHALYDTERGIYKYLESNQTGAEVSNTTHLRAFNSNGFDIGVNAQINISGDNLVSWTFRKAKKFFDVVTYTGNFTAGKTVSHNLGSVPAMIIFKDTSNTRNWYVYHRSLGKSTFLSLDQTIASFSNTFMLNNTDPTSTEFTLGEATNTNANGATFVAYLFAHNDGDGEFGPDGDADIIKCGSYTGNASGTGPEIDLGFEPQWLMVKNANNSNGRWLLIDNMRGWGMGDADIFFNAHLSDAEMGSQNWLDITPTGFKVTNSNGGINGSGQTHIYMAIRRGPLAIPEDATDVFHVQQQSSGDTYSVGFPTDLAILARTGGYSINSLVGTRLTSGKYLFTSASDAEGSGGNTFIWDLQNSFDQNYSNTPEWVGWHWKRAPSYFDVVTYTGTGSNRTINHNLGVAPEMIWVKARNATKDWQVYHSGLTSSAYKLMLNNTNGEGTSTVFNATAPTSDVFSLGTSSSGNGSGNDYIAYLFATLDGISKVGSYTGTGSALNIDCGFSSGARFVMVKRTDTTGAWRVFDTERGIVSGADPFLDLESTAAENSGDLIDPYSSGFSLSDSGNGNVNASGGEYIFYAIA